MKLNRGIEIMGENVTLVPYEKYHVPRYHEWMMSKELQKLTASEPLSLEQEYEMQHSWREDDNKCTFILLDRNLYEKTNDEIGSMIGDTNIFITDMANVTGEIEIMIAEESARGRRLGWEAVILMLLYGINQIHIKQYEAKISFSNIASIKMFEKLGFEVKSRSEVFQELTCERIVSNTWSKWLEGQVKYDMHNYRQK